MRYLASLKSWIPALSLGFAVFIFVSTELLPVGLLPDIARDLGKSEAATGLLLTVYAWMVALMSLPLTILSARFDRRALVLALLAAFIAAHLLAAAAWSFSALMAARICVALCHSVFWAVTPPFMARVAPEGKKAVALAIISCAVSLATVLGVPLGTLLGHSFGWRAAFGIVAAIACGVWLTLRRLLPPQPSSNAGSLRSLPLLIRRPELLRTYLLTVLLVAGNFTVFTYFAPFMAQVGRFSDNQVAFLLFVLGGAGIIGGFLGGKLAERRGRWLMAPPLLLMGVIFAMLSWPEANWDAISGFLSRLFSGIGAEGNGATAGTGAAATEGFDLVRTALICLVWGAALSFLCFTFQVRVLALAPDAADVAVSIHSAIFNAGIGGGALIGSWILTGGGLALLGCAGAFFAALALLACITPLGDSLK